jgi:hypothetical protein
MELGSFTSLIIPYYTSPLGDVAGILELGEPPIILWLLIWGARAQAANAKLPSVAN